MKFETIVERTFWTWISEVKRLAEEKEKQELHQNNSWIFGLE